MRCNLYQAKLEKTYDNPNSMYVKSVSHKTLKMQNICTQRYKKVIFNLRDRTIIYHGMSILLDAKVVKPRNLYDIHSHKIKNFVINRKERCCSR